MTKIALVTGANKGIGYETARLLAEQGMTVLVGARDEELGATAAAALGARFVRLDVSDDDSIARAAELVAAEYGRLDVLVNNAGITGSVEGARGGPSRTSRAALRQVFETNVFGLVAVTNAFLPLLRKADAARIVNVSSEVGSFTSMTDPANPLSGMAAIVYPTSKTAVNMITVMYAKELAGTGIKVNAAVPGHCATDLTRHTGDRSATDGATVSVHLATLPADGPTGRLLTDGGRQLPF
ncbi:SDR family NAD(P)-dependent oxidoreductase [Actinoplanes sp. L3-i22]|uniref:SDR family NAD(P)-dependent oxidoreductase n=1 Tax=Actinoplanes sp. L3-i22 TaxID=2836373 RepID=UPI001C77B61E|nr:SDR family NAD(P)-dependent oxidoreductase [Actinoplanes sp. L3-i22]BCY09751.1 dehydrogenase [Actinoplanes sp. L3-i22]